jgi:protein-disulfide isomerase
VGKTKRYFLTGSAITIILVGLVFSARFLNKTEASIASNNVKVKGSQNAPVHLVIYSDFQCPACRSALEPIEELRKEFSDSVQLEFRHYPLERPHRWALTAASFAECAAEQNKFWEFHDRLYLEQASWSVSQDAISTFANYSRDLGLNSEQLSACLGNPKTLSRIREERSSGERKGVQSTPTIFINDHMLVGALQVKEKGRGIILEELKKKGVGTTVIASEAKQSQS